jgi:hypothetical protein
MSRLHRIVDGSYFYELLSRDLEAPAWKGWHPMFRSDLSRPDILDLPATGSVKHSVRGSRTLIVSHRLPELDFGRTDSEGRCPKSPKYWLNRPSYVSS